ncbi:uncharacterized protein [Anabrus simplex]|uniref:uncharacterized protein n=1 Tax=Anabrus simplex TaxID=316456 RepID=UPI0035A27151
MRTILIVSVCVAALALTMVNSEIDSKALANCTVGLNLTNRDYERMTINGSSTREEKCLVACIFNVTGLMEDGKPTGKNAAELTEQMGRRQPSDTQKGIKEAIEKCSEEVKPTELCDTAEELRACLYENSKQYLNI